jgi:HAD superfamily hydrolase (TIGR01490 family)
MSQPVRAAFYDFDGTLVSSNVVTRYAYFAKHHPSLAEAAWRYGKLLLLVPFWIGLDLYSRRRFNEVFYREYRGLRRDFLLAKAEEMFEFEIRPKLYAYAEPLIAQDRADGLRLVLVSGGIDFNLDPVARYLGFDDLIANRLVFENGEATGEIVPPLLAEEEKVAAIRRYCREYNVNSAESKAYSDSLSDVPMLEAVGHPAVVNPGRRMKRLAKQRGWPVLYLR